ncbi:MAG: transglycosylase SLT domain-containing protein [Bdellovibrionales bacterium]
MNTLVNTIQNNALISMTRNAPAAVVGAIQQASAKTGVDFAYLVQQAKAESNFNPTAKARTSSAAGLFQFIESTWMQMMNKYGDQFGVDTSGQSRREVLNLRNDPAIASNMAAALASENRQYLDKTWGGDAGATELYFAHFLGAPKAAAFLNARDENGQAPAAVLFPKEAKANHNVFYESGTGRAKSLGEVYAFFDQKFDVKDLSPDTLYAENDNTQNTNGLYNLQHQSVLFQPRMQQAMRGMAAYNLVHSPLDLMLLSQTEESPDSPDSSNRKRSLFNS